MKSYLLDSDNEEKKQEWLALDLSLTSLTRELERLRSHHSAGNKTIQNEIVEKLNEFEQNLKAKAESTLDLVAKSDQVYLEEIAHLKDNIKGLLTDKLKLSDQLDVNKKIEKTLNMEMKLMKEKIDVFENVEDSKGPWFDIEAGGPMDIERITKALKKSYHLISVLQSKLDKQGKGSS